MNTPDLKKFKNAINKYGIATCQSCYESFIEGNGGSTIGESHSLTTNQADAAINAYEAIADFKTAAEEYCKARFSVGAEECGLDSDKIVFNEILNGAHPCDHVTYKAYKWDLEDGDTNFNWGEKYGFEDVFDIEE